MEKDYHKLITDLIEKITDEKTLKKIYLFIQSISG